MPSAPNHRTTGLSGLRRSGVVAELLFLFECLTTQPTQLRPIADALGVTVQAVSHSYRQLARRGLAEVREGRYMATVAGVAWLHEALGGLGEDVRSRLDMLHVVRTTRAVATEPLATGDRVSLELREGLLSARRGGAGPSRGRTLGSARAGSLVDVGELEGIVPLTRAPVQVYTLTPREVRDASVTKRLRQILSPAAHGGFLGAIGLEPYHVLRSATDRPVIRFAVAQACAEASKLGVPSVVLVLDTDVPRFLAEFSGNDPPPFDVRPLLRSRGGVRRRKWGG
ncbi:MAG: hypothetical protein L3J96_02975 [Thermoplasmata archaeon]|nr:hypothetical protein [Thermoplasmata archaeon]